MACRIRRRVQGRCHRAGWPWRLRIPPGSISPVEDLITRPAPADEQDHEEEVVGRLGMWTLGAAGGFFLAFWIGLIAILSVSDPAAVPASPGVAPTDGSGTAGGLAVTATEFAFEPAPFSARSGDVAITMRNDGLVFHNLEILTSAGEVVPGFTLEAEPGQQDAGDVSLSSGDYLLICSIPGHREAGMEAALTVTG